MSAPLLEVRGLCAYYGDFQALFDVDLSLHAGEVLALVGANGAGKSSLLKALLGQIRIGAGSVHLHGEGITAQAPHAAARRGIALSPEGRRLFASLSVEENLCIGRGRVGGAPRWTLDRIYALFPALGPKRQQPATELSGGQQQMVAIGRALMLQPQLLLLDELSLGLSPAAVNEVYAALPAIAADDVGVILVEQDIQRALQASARAVCLREGRVVLHGASDGLTREALSSAYFGFAADHTDEGAHAVA